MRGGVGEVAGRARGERGTREPCGSNKGCFFWEFLGQPKGVGGGVGEVARGGRARGGDGGGHQRAV